MITAWPSESRSHWNRSIIHVWRKHRTVVNHPRSDQPTKMTPTTDPEVPKEPRVNPCRPHSLKIKVYDLTKRERKGENCFHGRVPMPKPLLKARKNSLWTDETTVEVSRRCASCSTWHKTNCIGKRTWLQSNMEVVVWWSAAAVLLRDQNDLL